MEKKIIVAFGCGLGNQMFQYVFYNNLKERFLDYSVVMENKRVLLQQHNGYELDRVFGISIPECSEEDLKDYWPCIYEYGRYKLPLNIIKYIVRSVKPNPSFFKQPNYMEYFPEVYDEKIFDRYLYKGIWANEKYFKKNEGEIRKLFSFINEDKIDKGLNDLISNSKNSVSIHFRRGDYVKEGRLLLGKNYYSKCFNILEACIKDPEYWVFSDDVDAAQTLFSDFSFTRNINYVIGNEGENSWKDMCLMSKCKHNIVANSSFSFWGAYLNSNKNKMVIASKYGMNHGQTPFACDGWQLV